MTDSQPRETPDPAENLEAHWLPKFEAAATRETDPGRNLGHLVGHRERLRVFRDLAQRYLPPETASVLDVGCGSGTYFDLYKSLQWDIRGIDFSPAQIEVARRRHPDARLHAGRIEEAPPDLAADLVVCIGVTQAVTELGPFLRALAQHVLPGGRAIISCLNARSIWPGSILDPQLRFFSLGEISGLMRADFDIVTFRRFYPLPVVYPLAYRWLYRLQVPLLNHGFMFVLTPC